LYITTPFLPSSFAPNSALYIDILPIPQLFFKSAGIEILNF